MFCYVSSVCVLILSQPLFGLDDHNKAGHQKVQFAWKVQFQELLWNLQSMSFGIWETKTWQINHDHVTLATTNIKFYESIVETKSWSFLESPVQVFLWNPQSMSNRMMTQSALRNLVHKSLVIRSKCY